MKYPVEVRRDAAARMLQVEWDDGHRSSYPFAYLRGWCPCAECQGHGAEKRYVHAENTDLGSIEVSKIANFTVVDENPLDVDPLRLDEIDVVGTIFCGRWFPVPVGSRGRSALGRVRSLTLPADGDPLLEQAGCICDVAREVMRHVA